MIPEARAGMYSPSHTGGLTCELGARRAGCSPKRLMLRIILIVFSSGSVLKAGFFGNSCLKVVLVDLDGASTNWRRNPDWKNTWTVETNVPHAHHHIAKFLQLSSPVVRSAAPSRSSQPTFRAFFSVFPIRPTVKQPSLSRYPPWLSSKDWLDQSCLIVRGQS